VGAIREVAKRTAPADRFQLPPAIQRATADALRYVSEARPVVHRRTPFSSHLFGLGNPALEFEEKWPVDLVDIDSAVLNRLNRIGEFEEFSGRDFRVRIGAGAANFMT
jgi:hypothetical protein